MEEILFEKNFYYNLLDSIHDGVYFVDNEMRITFWNKSAEKITGYSKEEVMGKRCSQNILRHINEAGEPLCLNGCPLRSVLQSGTSFESKLFLHHKDGHRVPILVKSTAVTNAEKKIIGAVEIFSDQTTNKDFQQIEQLKKELYLDSLTHIPNRKYAEMRIKSKLFELHNFHNNFSLLFFDIDHFKQFNDTYGHLVGDRVLQMVARTTANTLRDIDDVCRWGGEEFVVLTSNTDPVQLLEIANRIRINVENSWLTIDDTQVKVTVSIGGCIASSDDTTESLIKKADLRMYQAKKTGRNCVSL